MRVLALILAIVTALAPLEPLDGTGVLFGSWFDRVNGDTALDTNKRLNYKPLSLFQSNANIGYSLQADLVDDIILQINQTNTDAIIYLTIYPLDGLDAVSDIAISDLAIKVKKVVQSGGRVMIRYASEMNGAWFTYGQKPTAFIKSWIRVVTAIRAVTGTDRVAFLWAPNSGNGYPYPSDTYSQTPQSPAWDSALDTNGDGAFTEADDPYSPYYPGDQYVDWVGLSVYHYGKQFPWITNDVPVPGQVISTLTGNGGFGRFNFYELFSGAGGAKSSGKKPFIFSETGASIHIAFNHPDGSLTVPLNSDPQSRVDIKRGWYQQILNAKFLATYPKVKGVCFFEFVKFEETTWRDFTTFASDSSQNSPLGNDGAVKDNLVLQAFQADLAAGMDKLIIWADSPSTAQQGSGSNGSTIGSTSSTFGSVAPSKSSDTALSSDLFISLLILAAQYI